MVKYCKEDGLVEGKIKCSLGHREILFLAGQESRECLIISDVGIRGIYLSLSWSNSNNRINHVLSINLFLRSSDPDPGSVDPSGPGRVQDLFISQGTSQHL